MSLRPINSMRSLTVSDGISIEKDNAYLFDTVGDTRQNHWTMKYRSVTSKNIRGHMQHGTEQVPGV